MMLFCNLCVVPFCSKSLGNDSNGCVLFHDLVSLSVVVDLELLQLTLKLCWISWVFHCRQLLYCLDQHLSCSLKFGVC